MKMARFAEFMTRMPTGIIFYVGISGLLFTPGWNLVGHLAGRLFHVSQLIHVRLETFKSFSSKTVPRQFPLLKVK